MVNNGTVAGKEFPKQGRAPRFGDALAGLERVNLNAAGIDVGSTSHYVAVPPGRGDVTVREFSCYTSGLQAMALWLKECRVETVVMECTGVYWIPVFEVLEEYGLDVKLIDARHAKNVPGRKTDVADCRWLQELHTFGLLSAAFVPPREEGMLRTFCRQRAMIVEGCSRQILHMQKALEQMNVQLHKVLSDISGVTGMAILRAIVAGEHDPETLAAMRHKKVRRSEAEIIDALTGHYRPDHLFCLTQALELFDVLHTKLKDCDSQIENHLKTFASKDALCPELPGSLNRRKNQPHFDLAAELRRITGVDLTKIPGIQSLIAYTVLSEIGFSVNAFPTEAQFCSWLSLCPKNRITGGRVKSSRTMKSKNRATTALRVAAQTLHKDESWLGVFYRKMRFRLGAPKAITATAHKLARIIYRMLKHGEAYIERAHAEHEAEQQKRTLKHLKKNAWKYGYMVVPIDETVPA